MLAPFHDPDVGAVGPLSDNVGGEQCVGLYVPREAMTSPGRVALTVRNAACVSPDKLKFTKMLIGFCLALRRDLIDQFGGLEEKCFLGADDIEMSWRLQCLGYRLAVAMDTFISHESHASFASLSSEQKQRAVFASDAALKAKLLDYYNGAGVPSSFQIWGSTIFEEAMNRATVSSLSIPNGQEETRLGD